MTPHKVHELARFVSPHNARSYALANGWRRVDVVNGGIAVFDRSDVDLEQLVIPLERSAPDYARRIVDLIDCLSAIEDRQTEEVLNDLLMPDADVVRYRVSSSETNRGDISLQWALGVLEGAKRSILAAACSVINPVRHHPRMSRTEATQLIEGARLRQTERGSFTVAIACPLSSVETEGTLFDAAEPFTRRTTSLLMRSVAGLASAIESDRIDSVLSPGENTTPISANLCEALLRMQPSDETATLTLSASWASTHPPDSPTAIPNRVRFQHDFFPAIESVFKSLRPASEPTRSVFVGYVDTLNGDVGEDGRVQGETTLLVLHDEEMIKARADLNADDYAQAIDAHRVGDLVKFAGNLHRGVRTHRITDTKEFEVLPDSHGT